MTSTSMEYSKKMNNDSCEFALSGKFTRKDLRSSQEILAFIKNSKPKKIVFDLSALSFIDSSALGQLLLIRDVMEHLESVVILSKPSGQIKKMLHVGNFYELFDIKD